MIAACPFPTHQGTQVLVRHLAQALASAGHDVHLFTYGEGDPTAPVSIEHGPRGHVDARAYTLHRARRAGIGPRSGPQIGKPFADAALLYTAHRALRSKPYDVIHAHNVEGLAVGNALQRLDGLPLVYHVHNAMGAELPTYFRGERTRRAAAWLGEVADRVLPRRADAIITFDNDHRALHAMYGLSESRLHVIAPGLALDEIQGARASTVESLREFLGAGPFILYAGNPDGYQNLPLLWAAYTRVRKKMPKARLLIVSHHPPSAFEPVLPPKRARKGIEVFQHGDLDDLRAAYALATVGVCPRVLWTGAPIKVLNYLAAGLPVVACRDAVRHILPREAGHAVEPDADLFAGALLDVLKDPKAFAFKPTSVLGGFDIETQVPLYESVYRSVIGESFAMPMG